MPTQRFLGLPEEKQARITQALIDEFADFGMDNASVAGVVKRADIPRGSFYQYFEGLDDALAYVHSMIMQAKQAYLSESMALIGKAPFFEFLTVAFARSLDFVAANPRYAAIGSHMLTSKDEKTKRLVQTARQQGEKLYSDLLQLDINRGLIAKDVDPIMVAKMVMPLFFDLTVRLLYDEHKSPEEVKHILQSTLEIIRRGVMIK